MLSSTKLTTDPLHSISDGHSEPKRRISNIFASCNMTARREGSGLRQTKPAFVACPRNRSSFPNAIRNTSQGFTPPDGLANHPRPPSATGVAELRKNTPRNYGNCKRQRAPHQSAPEFVPCMTMMNLNLISRTPGVMMADCDDRGEKHIVTRR